MSVINIFFYPERILCVSDTVIYSDKVPACLGECKVNIYGRMAVATRGKVPAIRAVNVAVDGYSDIDSAMDAISTAHEIILEHKESDDPDMAVETTVMGWSDERGALVAYRWEVLAGHDAVKFSALTPGMYLAPCFNSALPPLPPEMTDARMVKVALAQQNTSEAMGYSMCIGGVMHCTTVTPDEISRRIIGVYPGYDELAEEFGCPDAEAVRAFRKKMEMAA